MRSFPMISQHLVTYAMTLRSVLISLTLLAGAAVALPEHPAMAAPLGHGAWIIPIAKENSLVETAFRGGGCAQGRCRRVASSGKLLVAIAAGAAIGVVTAATAAAWAGAAPAPGYCWYYTGPSRRQGFWDVCG